MLRTPSTVALFFMLVSGASHAALRAVHSSPFDFSHPPHVAAEGSSFIKKVLRWVDGGGDLHTKNPDPARRPPENTTKTKTIRFKFYF